MLACARLTRSPEAFSVSGCPSATTLRPSTLTFLAAFESLRWCVPHGPLPVGERKVVVFIPACGTEPGRWKEPVYLNKVFAVPAGFVFHLAQQLSACGIQP